jgi:hypothetical protein
LEGRFIWTKQIAEKKSRRRNPKSQPRVAGDGRRGEEEVEEGQED